MDDQQRGNTSLDSFTGTWITDAFEELCLEQQAQDISGVYTGRGGGTMSGTLQGRLWHFSWRDDQAIGGADGWGFLRLMTNGTSLVGSWGYGEDRTHSEIVRAELLQRQTATTVTVNDQQPEQDKRDLRYHGFHLVAQGRFEEALPVLKKALALYKAEFQASSRQSYLFEEILIQGRLLQCYFGLADYQGVPETPQVEAQQRHFYSELLASLRSSIQLYRTFLSEREAVQPLAAGLADSIHQGLVLLAALRAEYTQHAPELDACLEQRSRMMTELENIIATLAQQSFGGVEALLEAFTALDGATEQVGQAILGDIEQMQALSHRQAPEERELIDQIVTYLQSIQAMMESKGRIIRLKKSQSEQNAEDIWEPAFELSQWLERWRLRLLTDAARIDALKDGQDFFKQIIEFFVDSGHEEEALVLSECARSRAFIDLLVARTQEPRAEAQAFSRLRPTPPATREELLAIVRQRRSLTLEYFFTRERLFIWVITPGGAITGYTSLGGRNELEELIREFVQLVNIADPDKEEARGKIEKRMREILQMLYVYLVQPIRQHIASLIEEEILTIIPHEQLFLVPFGALEDEWGKSLITRHTLVYAPAIDLLRYTQQNRTRVVHTEEPNLLAFVNPQTTLPALNYTEQHFAAITQFYGQSQATRVYAGSDALKERVQQEASDYTVLCFATHAKAFNDRPLDSYLALAAISDEDGSLRVPEISQLDVRADLVILSACETGLGEITGDGVIGLNRAFIVAGAPSLVMSLWSIPEEESLNQVYLFHDSWKREGTSKARALRDAQLEGLLNYPNQPDVWAGLILVGEWV